MFGYQKDMDMLQSALEIEQPWFVSYRDSLKRFVKEAAKARSQLQSSVLLPRHMFNEGNGSSCHCS
jgi:hypothetical protein